MGDDISNWIKAQNFRKNVTIVGHSLGGRSVVAMTAQHP
jgi:pimeloyl-ACP methyl ester carboxylesterase